MIQSTYAWVQQLQGPKHMEQALAWIGLKEKDGPEMNPVIRHWAEELKVGSIFFDDGVPWCGLFAAAMMKAAARSYPPEFYRAREWGLWDGLVMGNGGPSYGDVLVFWRGQSAGHVGFYVAEDKTAFHVLGGNQGDMVKIVRIPKARLLCARRPRYAVPPVSVRPYHVQGSGAVSTNEA